LRRLADLCAGDLSPRTHFLLDALPAVLDLKGRCGAGSDPGDRGSNRRGRTRQSRGRRETIPGEVRAHLIIVTKRDRPSPLFVVALIGAEKILRRDFDLTRGPDTFVDQALALVPTSVAAWGATAGFVINFTPDHALQFDVKGNLVATLSKAVRPGEADLTLKNGRSIVGVIRGASSQP
jgi:hypothetical protein